MNKPFGSLTFGVEGMERLTAYYPGRGFPAVSISGHSCMLNCDHCRGEHLKGMAAATPSSFTENVPLDAQGVLLSGGCDRFGRLDMSGCLEDIKELSAQGKRVAVHTVLPSAEESKALAESGVECICLDLHGDPSVIRNILHLDASPDDYERALIAARDSGARVFPHVTVGFSPSDWRYSLEMLARNQVREFAILGLVSTPGTPLEGREASVEEMVEAFRTALDMKLRPSLGCMRPRSHRSLERKLLEMGVREFASPSRNTLREAEAMGLQLVEEGLCCCLNRRWPRSASDSAWE